MRKCGTHLRSTGSYDHEVLVMWWLFDPVIGDALRSVGHRDPSALVESERLERAPHRYIVLVGVAAQVIGTLGCVAQDRSGSLFPAPRCHTVNNVVVGTAVP